MREGYIEELKARFKECSARITDLKTRAKSTESQEKRNEYLGVVDDLEQKKSWIGEDIIALELGGERGWDLLSDDIESAFKLLNEDCLKAITSFQ